METRPAPLDNMTAGEDGVDQFRVSSPREIGTILKQLLDGSVLLNLNAVDGKVLTSAIWTMDSARGTIGFNADPRDPAVKALMESHEVTVVGYVDNVKLQFEVHGLMLVNGHRASVLNCAFPREMYRFQRRNAFRIRPLMRTSPVARLRHPDMPEMEFALRIIDVSMSGAGLFLPNDVPLMNAGTQIDAVRLEFDEDTRLDVSMRLKHVTPIKAETGGVRLGFEFVRIGGDAVRTLQRFIDLTQKRAKMMALN
ncbi:MAG TPA: flagellar regulator YcgR PilZN domain-containing protein [Caldimonas sp.]|jgi:c-di-GMP-binding flagellar brake protein YcgR|nr:flagellar regulator YcgR PilZN domain-containing protein [Caldimonas sp.]HEX2541126.1 flagellar regulator YcgR PilZN domain-containing protein [Caldimonas sp.]